MELVEQRENLKRGREDSVSYFCRFSRHLYAIMLRQLICIAIGREGNCFGGAEGCGVTP
jgi:hypothetical protein